MKYLKYIFIYILLGCSMMAFSQNKALNIIEGSPAQITPSSPQSQIFEQYINHPVTEYYGLPEISIPLYTIEIKGVVVPINLNYHASGIKYKQFDGDIGAGWSISTGGYRVSRTIYGRPDDYSEIYDSQLLHNCLSGMDGCDGYSQDSLLASICLTPEQATNIEPSVVKHMKDGEYDHFMYMLPTTSGKFLLTDRRNLGITTLSDNSDIVKLNDGVYDGIIKSATIIDENGVKYLLGASAQSRESMYCPMVRSTVDTGWLLSCIETPYNDSIVFNYANHYVNIVRDSEMIYTMTDAPFHFAYNYPNYVNPNLVTKYNGAFSDQRDHYLDKTWLKLVSSVETNRIKISFKRTKAYSNSDHVLSEIIIVDKMTGECLKRIRFSYFTFPYSDGAQSEASPWHRLLQRIEILGSDNKNGGVYNFNYYLPELSLATAYPDQWGYYKFGYYESIGNSIYKGLFLHNEFAHDLILEQATKASGRKTEFGNLAFTVPFLDRSTNENPPIAFSLKSVNNLLGGSTYYTYESNQYNYGYKGGGLRIKKIESSGETAEHPIITEFIYGDDGNGSLSGAHSDLKQCFVDEYFFFSTREALPFGEKDSYALGTRQTVKIYATYPLNSEMNMISKIHYNKVARKQYDQATHSYLGQIVSIYAPKREYDPGYTHNPNAYPNDGLFSFFNYIGYGKMHIKQYDWWVNPELISRMTYNQDSVLVKKEKWEHNTLKNMYYEGLHVKQKVFFENYPGKTGAPRLCEHYGSISRIFDSQFYNIHYELRKPIRYDVWEYDLQGNNPVLTSTIYEYDSLNRLTTMKTTNSLNGEKGERYTYPKPNSALQRHNMVQTIVQKDIFNNGKATERFVYYYPDDSICLKKIKHSYGTDDDMRTEYSYDSYDLYGNLLQYTRIDGTVISYLWGYNALYPIAEIVNASLSDIYNYLDKNRIDNISQLVEPSVADWEAINSLRDQLKTAQVSTYKYKPLVGLIEKIAPSGLTTYYDYNSLGQLIQRGYKNKGGKNIIESYTYNLAKLY